MLLILQKIAATVATSPQLYWIFMVIVLFVQPFPANVGSPRIYGTRPRNCRILLMRLPKRRKKTESWQNPFIRINVVMVISGTHWHFQDTQASSPVHFLYNIINLCMKSFRFYYIFQSNFVMFLCIFKFIWHQFFISRYLRILQPVVIKSLCNSLGILCAASLTSVCSPLSLEISIYIIILYTRIIFSN